jgi:mannose-6-phosphate isomerase-like protein (cupin superfamily)
MRHARLDRLKSEGGEGTPVFPGLEFATPWSRYDYAELAPGQRYGNPAAGRCEEGYVVLAGRGALAADPAAGEVAGPGAILCPLGRKNILINPGPDDLRLLHVRVATGRAGADRAGWAERADRTRLGWRPAIHGGVGRIAARHLRGPDDFHSAWTFLDHAVLAPASSVGYHYHDALEESFVVLQGEGYATIADRTFGVGPGSVTWQGIRERHGIYNPGPGVLEFLRLAVAREGEAYSTVDLRDDLAGREPPEEDYGTGN